MRSAFNQWPAFMAEPPSAVPKLEELIQILDYSTFKIRAMVFLTKIRGAKEEWINYFFYALDSIKSKVFSQPEKFVLARFFVYYSDLNFTPKQINTLFNLIEKLKNKFGPEIFLLCENRINEGFNLNRALVLFEGMLAWNDLGDLTHTFLQLEEKLKVNTFVKDNARTLSKAAQRFGEKSQWVQFPLSAEKVEKLEKSSQAFEKFSVEILSWDTQKIIDQVKTLGKELANTKSPELKSHVLVLIIEVLKREMKVNPYDVQCLTLLALNDFNEKNIGQFAQILTSGGKTLTIALLAAFWGCQGQCVDVITTSRELAIEAQSQFSHFFSLLDLSSSHICKDDQERSDFSGQIIYATEHDIEFSILRDQFFNSELRYTPQEGVLKKRPLAIGIVDECDSLFIDSVLNASRIAIPSAEKTQWVYAPILEFVKNPGNKPKNAEGLRTYLSEFQKRKFFEQAQNFSDRKLLLWLDSALQALEHYSIDKEYTIVKGRVKIVDAENTGRISSQSRWSYGIHEFLEVKHNLKLEQESDTLASISHPALFRQYEMLFGLTGTIGELEERKEIEMLYGINTFDVPPHFPPVRNVKPSKFYLSRQLLFQGIYEDLVENMKSGQPTLALFTYICDVNDFSQFLNVNKCPHRLLNDVQDEAEDYLIELAGMPGMITLSTNISGRGTNILLQPASKAAGGLDVLLGFYPVNQRVQNQNIGRGSRNGDPGSCRIFICAEDPFIMKLIPDDTERNSLENNPNFIEILNQKRTEYISKFSNQRIKQSQKEIAYYALSLKFSNIINVIMKSVKAMSLSSLAEACSSLEDIPDDASPFPAYSSLYSKQKYAWNLLVLQKINKEVDWSQVFLKPMIEVYFLHLQQKWAQFFSNLELDHLMFFTSSQNEYESKINADYQDFFEKELRNNFENPEDGFIAFIGQLLGIDLLSTLRERVNQSLPSSCQ